MSNKVKYVSPQFIVDPSKTQILEESSIGFGISKIKMKVTLQEKDVVNNNRRSYDEEILKLIVAQLGPKATERKLLAELDHPIQQVDNIEEKHFEYFKDFNHSSFFEKFITDILFSQRFNNDISYPKIKNILSKNFNFENLFQNFKINNPEIDSLSNFENYILDKNKSNPYVCGVLSFEEKTIPEELKTKIIKYTAGC